MNEDDLLRKLAAIESLFAGAGTEGEEAAAAAARQRILDRLESIRQTGKTTEYRFSLSDPFSRRLFVALARRYGLKPYRYPRQRRTTVMLAAPAEFIDEVFWPEFEELAAVLHGYLDEVTDRVIRRTVHEDVSEAAEAREAGHLEAGTEKA